MFQEILDFTYYLKIVLDDNGGSCVAFSVVTNGQ